MSTPHNAAFWLIELLVWWEGSVRPSQLLTYWQCTRQHASKKLDQYKQARPEALEYSAARKTYLPSASFLPSYISCQANEYLNWLVGYSPVSEQQLATLTLQPPPRKITPELMRPLIRALREGRRVDVDYGSVSRAQAEGRVIAPHHLVKTANRWHIRAWCEDNQQFRDFVLSRFNGTPELLNKNTMTAVHDEAWNTQVEVVLAPDPRLSPEKRQVIEQDYGMQNGQLSLTSRACMVNYLLQSLNLDVNKIEAQPEAQQLVIVNLNDIKPWLFG